MQGIAQAVRHIALAALLLRALIPAGWMPDAQAGITLCSVDATLGAVHHDGESRHDDGTGHQDSHEECPFAAAPHLGFAPEAVHIALPAQHAAAAITDSVRAALIAARFTPGSPRAPPRAV